MATIERRNYTRRDADFLTVTRRYDENGCLPQAGYSRNISAGGLYLYARTSIIQGDRIRLTIYPDHDWMEKATSLRLVAAGKVLRVE